MTGYNISYGFTKLNKEPLSKEIIDKILKQEFINKQIDDKIIQIPIKDLTINSCVIIN